MVEEFSAPVQAQSSATFKKPVETIAIIPKSGKVTLLTRKLFNVLLDIAQQHNQKMGEDVPVYRTALSKITTNASFNSNDTALIKEHLRKMNSIQVEWNPGKSKDVQRRWGVTSLVAEAEVIEDPHTHRTFIEWSYSPKLKKRLLEPDVYTRISLQMQSALRSGASLSLYEICYRYSTSPNSLTMREPWEWWRPALTGSPDDEMEKDTYKEYKYFKRDVLKPAISEVNAVTDLNVELIEHKDGRRIVELQFKVTRKAQGSLPLVDRSLLNMGLIKKMLDLGLTQEEAERIYSDTEESLIEVSLKSVAARLANKKQTPLENPGAWFLSVLKRGPVPAAPLPKLAKAKPAPKQTLEDLKARYLQQKRNEARAMFAEMVEGDRHGLGEKFREHLVSDGDTSLLQVYDQKGLANKRVEVAFFFWLTDRTWGPPTDKDLLAFALGQS